MDKCKFCGADVENPGEPYTWFDCLTAHGSETDDPPVWHRSSECYERQIADLTERLEAWRELRQFPITLREYFKEIPALKDLGEI